MCFKDDRFLTLIATVNAIANIFTRFFWGILFDKISFKVNLQYEIRSLEIEAFSSML